MLIFFLLSFLFTDAAVSLEGQDIIQLKNAGVEDETIKLLIKEKSFETASFTVEEIINLKAAGVADQTIRMLVVERSFTNNREPVVYGVNIRPMKFTTIQDLINLKEAGFSDEVIQTVIKATKAENDVEKERAWRMLESMGIRIRYHDKSMEIPRGN